jgi:sugar phosphate isomerase/epimerase
VTINRRKFVTRAAGAVAIGVPSMSQQAWSDPMGLPIGIQLYTIGDDMQKDAPAAVKKIAQIGYKEVETAGFGSAGSAAALRKLLDDNGLKCPSAHLTFDLKNLNKAFDQAHALGCTYATASVPRMLVRETPSLDGPERAKAIQMISAMMSEPWTNDELKRMIDAMNQIANAAKKQRLTFASHNHTYEFLTAGGQPALYRMIPQTAASGVVFEIDCGWATVAGYNPVDLVNKFPGRIKMLHVKDFLAFEKGAAPASANAPKGSEIGQGVVDYKKIFAGMKGKGIQHIFVEQEGPFTRMPAMQSAEVDFKYLHSLV